MSDDGFVPSTGYYDRDRLPSELLKTSFFFLFWVVIVVVLGCKISKSEVTTISKKYVWHCIIIYTGTPFLLVVDHRLFNRVRSVRLSGVTPLRPRTSPLNRVLTPNGESTTSKFTGWRRPGPGGSKRDREDKRVVEDLEDCRYLSP